MSTIRNGKKTQPKLPAANNVARHPAISSTEQALVAFFAELGRANRDEPVSRLAFFGGKESGRAARN